MSTRVIGLGQSAAGDDGVGLAVLQWIRDAGAPAGTELLEVREATELIALLETPRPVVLVDAMVGHGAIGEVLAFGVEALDAPSRGPRPVSTHGVDIGHAIALARLLSGDALSPAIWVVGVTIAPPRRFVHGLSPAVHAAIPAAARAVLARAGDEAQSG